MVISRTLGTEAYAPVWERMREFTDTRTAETPDEVWSVQHFPVFTLGQAGRCEHVRDVGTIPVVRSDRGGQVTYHGPGQCVVYTLFDLRRAKVGVRDLVSGLEQSVIDVLQCHGIAGARLDGAPGVYVDGAKIGALGLRVRRGCAYHGVSLNVDVDLAP